MPTKGEIRINPQTQQLETLTPEGEWSSQRLESQIGVLGQKTKEIGVQTSELAKKKLAEVSKITELQPTKTIDVDIASPTGERLRVSTSNLAEYLEKGFKVVPTETTEVKTDEFGRPITAIPSELLEGEETPEQKQLKETQASFKDLDIQAQKLQSDIEVIRTSQKDGTEDLKRQIQLQYAARKEQMAGINRRSLKQLETGLLRAGTARYAESVALSLTNFEENQGLVRLAEITAEENIKIAELKKAQTDKNYDILLKASDRLDKLRDEKVKEMKGLSEKISENNKKIEEKQEKVKKSIVINDLNNQGKTASEIYDAINFDEDGNMIENPMTISEITDAIEETKITDDVRIENINKFFGEKIEGITAQDYLRAQKDWLASGGTIADFKGAFPPDSLLDDEELKKLPKSIWTPEKPKELTEAEKLKSARRTMNSKLDSVKGEDGYISPQDWNEAKRSWIAEGLNADDFIGQFYIYINPVDPEDYGIRETNYLREIGGGGKLTNPFE